jgi:hypothetical protein
MNFFLKSIFCLAVIAAIACSEKNSNRVGNTGKNADANPNRATKLESAVSASEIILRRSLQNDSAQSDLSSCAPAVEFKLAGLSVTESTLENCKVVGTPDQATISQEKRDSFVSFLSTIVLKPASESPCPEATPESVVTLLIDGKGYSYRSDECGSGGMIVSDSDLFELLRQYHQLFGR